MYREWNSKCFFFKYFTILQQALHGNLFNCSSLFSFFPLAPSGLNVVISKSFSRKSIASEISADRSTWRVNRAHAFCLGLWVLAFLLDVPCSSKAFLFSTVCTSGPTACCLHLNLEAWEIALFVAILNRCEELSVSWVVITILTCSWTWAELRRTQLKFVQS